MDFLRLNTIAFPVLRGSLSKPQSEPGDYYCWNIEIHCGESVQQGLPNPNRAVEEDLHWVLGTEAYLSAQMLPFRVATPDELVGRRYEFPQSPDDDPADWEPDQWPFFVLYTYEHDQVYPMTVTFTAKRDRQYRVEIRGEYPANETCYDLRVEAWLDWEE